MRTFAETAVGNLHIDAKKAFEFFAAYARYEYAVKVLGWVISKEPRAELKICPKTVADAIAVRFETQKSEKPDLARAVEYFSAQAPQKQKWKDNRPTWEPMRNNERGVLLLLLQLGQARNNLFHGGKGWKPEGPAGRDNEVIRHGLVILEAVVSSNEQLSEAFSSFE